MRLLLHRLVDKAGNGVAFLFAVVALITAYEVVMRYVFGAPTRWVHELSIALCAVAFAFGGPYAMRHDAHLRISALYNRLGRRFRRLCAAVSVVSGVLYLGALAYAFTIRAIETGWRFEDGRWAPETTGRAWDIPIPPFMNGIIALCCVVFIALLFRRPAVNDEGA